MRFDQTPSLSTGATSSGATSSRGWSRRPPTHATAPSGVTSAASTSSASVAAAFCARVRRWSASATSVVMDRSAVRSRSMASRPRPSDSASGVGRGDGSSWPDHGASCSPRSVPASTRAPSSSGSARIRRASRARLAKRPAPMASPAVSEVMSSSWWASSMTTTSCSGRMAPPDPTSMPYRWVLTTTTSAAAARRRAVSAKQGSPSGQRWAPGHSSLDTLTAAHARSLGLHSSSARSPVVVVAAQVARRSTSCRFDGSRSSSSSWPDPGSRTSRTRWRHR